MSLIDNLYTFLEEQDEKLFIPNCESQLTEEEAKERFKITTKEQANYYVRKYKELEIAEQEVIDTAALELKRITKNLEEWQERELNKLQYPKYFFKGLLEEYAHENITDDKKRTISLPSGSISFKKQQDEYIYDDDTLKYYLQNTSYVTREEVVKLDKKTLKKDICMVDNKAYLNGQEIPGIQVNQRDMKFDIK